MFVYSQLNGQLTQNNTIIGTCYSGHGQGLNNPLAQSTEGLGPIPQGLYIIGTWHDVFRLGPNVAALIPNQANQMFGRSGFFIHGDNAELNHTASDGCIIADHSIREFMSMSNDFNLQVVA